MLGDIIIDIVAFVNTRSIREEAWFRDLGVSGAQRAGMN